MKIAVIGGGASGLFVAGLLSSKNYDVTIFESNEKLGKKIYITGKGRCNFTNCCANDEFLNNVVRGSKFLQSALSKFSPSDTISFFESMGMPVKIERGNRAFPKSDKSSDVIKILSDFSKNCRILLNHRVKKVYKKDNVFVVDGEIFEKVIIATGGKSYCATGSNGDGYNFAKAFGHNIITTRPALVAIELKNNYIKSLQGLSLKNVRLTAVCQNKKFSQFGEMLFTDKGISGPIVLTLSSYINRLNCDRLELDFKPALSIEQLDARLIREFSASKNKNLSNVMASLLPKKFISPFLNYLKYPLNQKVNSVTYEQRKQIVSLLKCWTLDYKMLYPMDTAIITSGGVDLLQINPKNMESKLVPGLYFIGEVLDVDALTGGFNLQIAFSTAYALADSI